MAPSLRQLVLAAYCVVLLAVFSASTSSPPPAARGDEVVLTVPPAPANGSGGETPNHWAMRHRFHVGDILDFKRWEGAVLLVRRGEYGKCGAARPFLRFAAGNNTATRISLDDPGLFYFISGAPARCEAGQRLVVRVAAPRGASATGAPAPAPADVVQQTAPPDQSVPSPWPWRMVAYAVLVFLAGFIFTASCLFCLMRCCC